MIGALAEELSAVVQWYWWGSCIRILIKDVLVCVPILQQLELIPEHSSSGLTFPGFSEFVSCPDNGLSMPQVVGHL